MFNEIFKKRKIMQIYFAIISFSFAYIASIISPVDILIMKFGTTKQRKFFEQLIRYKNAV